MPRDFSQSSSLYLASIDAEIVRLQKLRSHVSTAVEADEAIAKPAKTGRKGMSEEGRRRVAEAQKARWAKQKKAAKSAGKTPAKKVAAKKSAVKKATAKKSSAAKTTEQA